MAVETQEAPVQPEAQVAIDELAAQAQTPEDQAALAAWQTELDTERKAALEAIQNPREVIALPNGVVASAEEVKASQARGEESAVQTTAGRMS